MAHQFDLDAYMARIGYRGPRAPTLECLSAVHALHPAAIPFEAIDVLLGQPVDLDPAAVDDKLIRRRRGGYCYEQNSLFKRALSAMGFGVEALLGRVRWMVPPGGPAVPRTHMALRVMIDGRPWLADVGFGACVMRSPLPMDEGAQATDRDGFRLVPRGEELGLEILLGENWTAAYDVSLQAQLDVDIEPVNWFTATHPHSIFRKTLMVARTTDDAAFALLQNRLTIRRKGGIVERRFLDPDQIEQALSDIFGLSVEPEWRPLIREVGDLTPIAAPQKNT